MSPPVLSSAFGKLQSGRASRSGYLFQMFLPGKGESWLAEAATGGVGTMAPDAKQAAQHWRCYAWPIVYGRSGKRAFVVDESRTVRACDAEGSFDGDQKPVPVDAAYGAGAAQWHQTR